MLPKILPLLILLCLAGCQTFQFDHSFDPQVDLANASTFNLLPSPHPEWDELANEILGRDNLALELAKSVLESKGYVYENRESVDFFIGVRASSALREEPQAQSAVPNPTLASYTWEPRPPPHQTDPTYRKQIATNKKLYETGENLNVNETELYLIIEVFETQNSSLCWQGWSRAHSIDSFRGNRTKAKLVSQILEAFPN